MDLEFVLNNVLLINYLITNFVLINAQFRIFLMKIKIVDNVNIIKLLILW